MTVTSTNSPASPIILDSLVEQRGPSNWFAHGCQIIDCRLRLDLQTANDLRSRQNLVHVARTLSNRQASLRDVTIELARPRDGAFAVRWDLVAIEGGRANIRAFRLGDGSGRGPRMSEPLNHGLRLFRCRSLSVC